MAAPPTQPTDRLQGTLDLLILRVLRNDTIHGWGIAQQIQQISRSVLQVNQGSLYPALHRLEERGWIAAKWGTSENNRRARYYSLTAAGRKQLAHETASWEDFVLAVSRILQTA
jgi:PadR family transcriptional regulator, regulatory protein PadR